MWSPDQMQLMAPLLEEAFLGNPYRPEVRQCRRALKAGSGLPGSPGEWRRWWERLPPTLQDVPMGLVLCLGLSDSSPLASSGERIGEAARILPGAIRNVCAELAARCLAVVARLDRIVGDTEVMRQVRQEAWGAAFGQSLASVQGLASLIQSTPVLIRGETGTGKELVAQALCLSMPGIWKGGSWEAAPHETVHLASLPDTLVESTLFGHTKGAYTGATVEQQGVFERCHGGVVFLDEVAELPAKTQVALLRTLQEGKVRRLGGSKDENGAPRLVSATHRDLEQQVGEGVFREDLLHRLSSVIITLPPLRARREDIPVIAEAEIEKADVSLRAELKERFLQFMEGVQNYSWPGNVRELSKVVRTLALGLEPRLGVLRQSTRTDGEAVPEELLRGTWDLAQVRSWYAAHVLKRCGSQAKTAVRLGIDRGTLRKLLSSHEHES